MMYSPPFFLTLCFHWCSIIHTLVCQIRLLNSRKKLSSISSFLRKLMHTDTWHVHIRKLKCLDVYEFILLFENFELILFTLPFYFVNSVLFHNQVTLLNSFQCHSASQQHPPNLAYASSIRKKNMLACIYPVGVTESC